MYKTFLPIILNGESEDNINASDAGYISNVELEFFELIKNHPEQRRNRDLIFQSPILQLSTNYRSQDMIDKNYVGHISPTYEYPNEVAIRYGCSSITGPKSNGIESIVVGTHDPLVGFNALMNSPNHKMHLMGENEHFATFYGIGVSLCIGENSKYRYYWTIHIANC